MSSIEPYMTKAIITAEPSETIDKIAKRMRDAGTGTVLVIENSKLVGLLSERDIMNRVVAEGRDPATTSAGEVATRQVVSVGSDASLRSCAETLRELGVRHLPVVENDRPIGIVSARDFFETVAGQLEALIGRIRYDAQLQENIDPYDHVGGSYGR